MCSCRGVSQQQWCGWAKGEKAEALQPPVRVVTPSGFCQRWFSWCCSWQVPLAGRWRRMPRDHFLVPCLPVGQCFPMFAVRRRQSWAKNSPNRDFLQLEKRWHWGRSVCYCLNTLNKFVVSQKGASTSNTVVFLFLLSVWVLIFQVFMHISIVTGNLTSTE